MATVLVVEDDLLVADLLQDVFASAGHRVVVAGSGKEALRLFTEVRPYITILDMGLPDMRGLTVLEELRKVDRKAAVIALPGGVDIALENEIRKLGVSDFLRKGLDLQVVIDSVTRTLDRAERLVSAATLHPEATRTSILVVDDDHVRLEGVDLFDVGILGATDVGQSRLFAEPRARQGFDAEGEERLGGRGDE
jgi:DNA-binding NtrC family response regulator